MAEVSWTSGALEDIDAIAAYIALDSTFRAGQQVSRILAVEALLERFPNGGRRVPEMRNTAIREVILPPYRILYHVDAKHDLVVVLAVIHSRRKLPGTVVRKRRPR
ncbi:MAG TPA: type II toxin-antitoxin system RelE/ParE family toxin [Flavobacteriales bacterium]|jgi:plasmid stabilization system protein ParE|nr:type II toxin-antitoxin system RelE/ParE family toxin [Flavobacteriales bacterium]